VFEEECSKISFQICSVALRKRSFHFSLTVHHPFYSILNHFNWKELDPFYDFVLLRYRSTGDPKSHGTHPVVQLSGSHDSVQMALKYAVSFCHIPASKIVLGLPTYFLDYTLQSVVKNFDDIHFGLPFRYFTYPSYPEV